MKRFVMVIMLSLMLCGIAYGAAVDIGAEGDFTINKDIILKNLDVEGNLAVQNYDATLAIPVGEWLVITPKLGLSTGSIGVEDGDTTVDLNSGIGWNAGADGLVKLYKGVVDLSLVGSYRFTRVDIDEIDINGLTIDNPIETILTTNKYEVGARVSKDLKEYGIPVTPYVGVVYSDLVGGIDVNLSLIELKEDIEAKDNVGIRVGLEGKPMDNLTVAVEGRFVDETAAMGKASYKF